VGDRFVRGVAAYLGPTIVPFARNIHAVPIGLLLGMRAVQLARPGDKPEQGPQSSSHSAQGRL